MPCQRPVRAIFEGEVAPELNLCKATQAVIEPNEKPAKRRTRAQDATSPRAPAPPTLGSKLHPKTALEERESDPSSTHPSREDAHTRTLSERGRGGGMNFKRLLKQKRKRGLRG